MFLAELVPDPARISGIILVDRGWPNPHIGSKGSISNEHVYDFGKWRVPLSTIKSDLKEQGNLKSMVERVIAYEDRPCLICAVHLCGTLSLRAAQLFNATARAQALALVPCCMPPKSHATKEVVYQLGSHTFSAAEVRSFQLHPRAADRFRSWVENILQAIEPGPGGDKELSSISIGGNSSNHPKSEAYAQDLHVFAQRAPWGTLERPPVSQEAETAGVPVVTEARWLLPFRAAKGTEVPAAKGTEVPAAKGTEGPAAKGAEEPSSG